MPTEEQIVDILKQCYDPEIPINIYDLGLIYHVEAQPDSVLVKMTLTTAACPAALSLPEQVRQRIATGLGVEKVNVELTFDPPWTPERISAEGRKKLGIPGDTQTGQPIPSGEAQARLNQRSSDKS